MGIDPSERTTLVFTGPYAWVRHPIYALSLMMMLATMLALPSPLMLTAGVTHLALLVWEARREEHYLAALHGATYRQYCSRVGRFVPRSESKKAVGSYE
jgi:protein-S-isoprenylcysteine O-methyltransferase Ste14